MTTPRFTAEAALTRGATYTSNPSTEERFTDRDHRIVAQSCGFWEWMACAGTVAGCALSCAVTGSECFDCFKRAGREVCYACV